MSCALAQRFSPDTPFFHRFLIGYDVTDELFGITIARRLADPYYTYGAILVAAPAWSIGTALGIIAGNLLPLRAVSALSVALYGMFLAIIIPPARKSRVVAGLVAVSFFLKLYLQLSPGHLHSLRRNQNDSAHRSDFLRRSYHVPGKDRGGKC
mgnify:CR=1 FL=1